MNAPSRHDLKRPGVQMAPSKPQETQHAEVTDLLDDAKPA